jgi:DDE domain
MDEVFIRIRGKRHYLWRAVDQDGNVLDILVQSRRSATAARRFFRKLLKGLRYVPRVIVTDKLKSYAAAKRVILPSVEHRQSRYLNNRAEVSHQPTRRRERQMKRFKSARHAQRFLSSHSQIHNHFQLRRHHISANEHRAARDAAFRDGLTSPELRLPCKPRVAVLWPSMSAYWQPDNARRDVQTLPFDRAGTANAEELVAAYGGNARDPRAKAAKLFKGVEDVKGRWRGGRVLGTSEIRYANWPTTEEVLDKGTDISGKVLRYLVAISHY